MYSLMGDYLQGNPYYLLDREVFNVRVLGITGMLLSPFAGFFVKRWGELIVLRFSLSIALIGLFFMVISNNLWFTISASVGYVAGISLTFPVLMKIIGDLGGEARSVASALYAFILFVGASLGPMTSLYFKGIAGYHGALLSLASCLFISCWVAFLSKLLREKSDASFSEST
ncbi:MFS transporter [Virgibacillus salexigens]